MSERVTENVMKVTSMSFGFARQGWGWILAFGIGLLILGIAAISMPLLATLAIEMIIGWLLVVAGIMEFFSAFGSQRGKSLAWSLIWGLLFLVVGIMLLANPFKGAGALTLLLAIMLAAEGIVKFIMAFRYRALHNWGWTLFSGVVSLALAGLILAKWPSTVAWVIGLLVGVDLLFGGMAMVMMSMTVRRLSKEEAAGEIKESPAM